jgi:hypothetical protein
MADPNLADFYSNVASFEKKHAKGYRFEAAGTIGGYRRIKARRRSFIKPLLLVLGCGIGLKAMIYQNVGHDAYVSRVAGLQAGQGMDLLGGFLMQADPVTVFVADKIGQGLRQLK